MGYADRIGIAMKEAEEVWASVSVLLDDMAKEPIDAIDDNIEGVLHDARARIIAGYDLLCKAEGLARKPRED